MPYIKQESRIPLDPFIASLVALLQNTVGGPIAYGDLNYVITRLCVLLLGDNYHYVDLQNMMGCLNCMRDEFDRRLVAPYERKKCKENGDVYSS